jgi:hypothetical protein
MACNNCGPQLDQCCCGSQQGHCDSTAFDSSCTDEGQGYPLSYAEGCLAPIYTPIPGIVGVWDGTQFLLDSDSSS